MKYNINTDIEYCMIATLIMNPALLKSLPLKEEYFFSNNNRLAFVTLQQMIWKDEEINLITFGSRFYDNNGKISEIRFLFDSNKYWSDIFAETYLRQLADELIKRKIVEKYNSLASAPKEFIEEIKKLEYDFIENRPRAIGELYDEYVEIYNERKEKLKDGHVGIVTGFNYIDKNCAFEEGNLVILAAKTSVGKTSLALNIAINAAMFGNKVLFFSSEMTIRELLNRTFSQISGISSTRFKYSNADNSLKLIKNEIEVCKNNLIFVESAGMTSEDICRLSRKEKNVDLIVVDYIQYLRDPVKNGTNNDRIGNITRNLKSIAVELKCSVLALSQVNRATNGAPELNNLRDSGNIEQDADIVLILHRENREDSIADLIIAKNRNGAVDYNGKIHFHPELTKFYEQEKSKN